MQSSPNDGLKLVVLFVPRPVVVYGDLVTPPLPAEAWVAHYRALQVRLEAEGIALVNPIEALRREARARLAAGEYLYHLDDTHWNAQGIAVTVDEILRVLPSADWPASVSSPGVLQKPGHRVLRLGVPADVGQEDPPQGRSDSR